MIPFHKIYFILYNPGGSGSFIQNILNLSEKYSSIVPDKFDFDDGTAHALRNDCFINFHGIDEEWREETLDWQYEEINALKDRDSLFSYLQGRWRGDKHEYYSQRIATLTHYSLINLLPESKFIYCKLDVLNTCRNLDTKVGLKDFDRKNIIHVLSYFDKIIKDIDNFLTNDYSNVFILDIFDFLYNDNTVEIDKLIKFCDMEVDKEALVKLIHLYRNSQKNLVHNPMWDKFLTAYEKLNK